MQMIPKPNAPLRPEAKKPVFSPRFLGEEIRLNLSRSPIRAFLLYFAAPAKPPDHLILAAEEPGFPRRSPKRETLVILFR